MQVGVLALQGDVREHIKALGECGVSATAVKTAKEISAVSALVIPGGESTTISKLAKSFDLLDLIREKIASGMPTFGTCAGMILLANKIEDGIKDQESFGGLDITVRRNAFGRQIDSFEIDLQFKGITDPKIHAVFIRAPWVESVAADVEVLATIVDSSGKNHPVAVMQKNILATAFHPELTADNRVHKFFVENLCRQRVN
jgi:5'-phosphate synthase pdxT subunit